MRTGTINRIEGHLIELELAYDRIESLYDFGFTREFFDNTAYREYPKGHYDTARLHYDILGNELGILGKAIAEARDYIKELENDKDKSKLQ